MQPLPPPLIREQRPGGALIVEHLTCDLVRSHPDKTFVFGDNLLRRGMAGQAIIRGESNAFGIPTKRLPSMDKLALFSDRPDEMDAVLTALRELYVLARTTQIVFPWSGLGTGMGRMDAVSPGIYRKMTTILCDHFRFMQPVKFGRAGTARHR